MATKYTARQKLQMDSERRTKELKSNRVKRDKKIILLRAQGLSQLAIANKMGLTYQRVGQIIKKHTEEAA